MKLSSLNIFHRELEKHLFKKFFRNFIYCMIFTLIALTFLLSDNLVLQSSLKKNSIIIFAIFLIEVIYLSLPNFVVKEFTLLPIIYIFPLSLFLFLIILNINKNYKYKGVRK